MTTGVDFVTRAHALWRVRMAQWQQRFGFFSKRLHQVKYLCLHRNIQGGRRFISDQDFWATRQCHSNHYSLTHPT